MASSLLLPVASASASATPELCLASRLIASSCLRLRDPIGLSRTKRWHSSIAPVSRHRALVPAALKSLALVRHASVVANSSFPPPAQRAHSTVVVPPSTPYDQLTVGVPKELFPGEHRVALTPANVVLLKKKGFAKVLVERGAGAHADFLDAAYEQAGATIVDAKDVWSGSDIVLKVRGPELSEVDVIKEGQTIISFLQPAQNKDLVEKIAAKKATSFAMDMVPRISRAQVFAIAPLSLNCHKLMSSCPWRFQVLKEFCVFINSGPCSNSDNFTRSVVDYADFGSPSKSKLKKIRKKSVVDFGKVEMELLPTVVLVGRPNVGKSALFNRFIRRREALVYNTPNDHVTRDIREGIAKLGDLRFRVLDSAGLEMAASTGHVLGRTAEMTGNVLSASQFALFLIDVRDGLQPMDLEVGKWLRKHAPGISTILIMNKSESLDDQAGSLIAAFGEAHKLGYGDPIAISAETGLGMAELYEALQPPLEEYVVRKLNEKASLDCSSSNAEDSKLPLQLAIVGRPNVGKSTLLNALLQQDRVLVGPEAGLTRDSVRAQFRYQERTIYMVDTAGWLQQTKQEKGPASLSVMQSRKSLMRAHVVALVLDAEEIAKARSSVKHDEVAIARRAVEEGRGLVVIVNKMDCLRGEQNSELYKKVLKVVPEEIQTVIPQVTGIPVVFVSALEGKGRIAVMHQVINTYEKWCLRLPTARINRWLRKVMSRHSWKDQAAQPKIKYFTQVKARPPTFVAFLSGKTQLSDTELRFLMKSLKEDFDMGGIPIRIMQRSVPRKAGGNGGHCSRSSQSAGRMPDRISSDKRSGYG